MVNVVLFPGNIELNHTVGVSDVVYCNSRVRFPRQLVKIAFNFFISLRELERSAEKYRVKLSFIRFNISSPFGSKAAFIFSCFLNANRMGICFNRFLIPRPSVTVRPVNQPEYGYNVTGEPRNVNCKVWRLTSVTG